MLASVSVVEKGIFYFDSGMNIPFTVSALVWDFGQIPLLDTGKKNRYNENIIS